MDYFKRQWNCGLGSCVFAFAILGLFSSCDVECREAPAEPFEVACDDQSGFFGELHFDRAATFRSFLTAECLANDSERVNAIVDAVDFSQDGVVFMRGIGNLNGECLKMRDAKSVEVCGSGLRVSFEDEVASGEDCLSNIWTIAFSMPRSELRAALENRPEAL